MNCIPLALLKGVPTSFPNPTQQDYMDQPWFLSKVAGKRNQMNLNFVSSAYTPLLNCKLQTYSHDPDFDESIALFRYSNVHIVVNQSSNFLQFSTIILHTLIDKGRR